LVENIACKFEKAMKKGFISTLVLMVLENEPMHGRQIKKTIEDRTFGGWEPTDSTIYTILKDLREKNLIRYQTQIKKQDEKTITYEITEDGQNTLKIMIKKEQEIRESMRAILTSTFGIKDELSSSELKELPSFAKMANKREILEFQRTFFNKRIEMLNQKLQKIENRISKFNDENRNENKK